MLQTWNLPHLSVHQRALHDVLGNVDKPNCAQPGFGVLISIFASGQHLCSHLEMHISFWGEMIQGFIPLGWCNRPSRFSTATVPGVTAGSVPWEGTKHRLQCVTAPALTHLMTGMMTWCQELITGRRHLTTLLHASACHLGCPSLQQLWNLFPLNFFQRFLLCVFGGGGVFCCWLVGVGWLVCLGFFVVFCF